MATIPISSTSLGKDLSGVGSVYHFLVYYDSSKPQTSTKIGIMKGLKTGNHLGTTSKQDTALFKNTLTKNEKT